MQGGHYTAYVRVRKTDSHTPLTVMGGDSETMNHTSEEVGEQKGGGVSSTMESVATNGVSTQATTTDEHRETRTDHTPTNSVIVPSLSVTTRSHTRSTNQCDTTNDELPTVANHSGTCSIGNQTTTTATCSQDNITGNQTETTLTYKGTTLPHTSLHSSDHEQPPNQTSLEFDLSSTSGQWYHISDTHVRTATQTEVDRSQAYILFYESLRACECLIHVLLS